MQRKLLERRILGLRSTLHKLKAVATKWLPSGPPEDLHQRIVSTEVLLKELELRYAGYGKAPLVARRSFVHGIHEEGRDPG